jgi:diguanylate cyclase (GGDEF)-like protein
MDIGVSQIGYEMALAFVSLFHGLFTLSVYRSTVGFHSLRWFAAAFFVFTGSTGLTALGIYLRLQVGDLQLGGAVVFISNLIALLAFMLYCIGLQKHIQPKAVFKYINAIYLIISVLFYSVSGLAIVGRYLISAYLLVNAYYALKSKKPETGNALIIIVGGLLTAVANFLLFEPVSGFLLYTFGNHVPFQAFIYYGFSILFFLQIGLGVFKLVTQMQADKLEQLAKTDPLTGALNRRSMHEIANREFERAQRYSTKLSVVMIDLDHFKRVNDVYGHAAGDAVLAKLASVIQSSIRVSDYFFRFGGEEFLVMLAETDLVEAREFAEKIRALVARQTIAEYEGLKLTVSLGAASYSDEESIEEIVRNADTALYEAKKTGRNRTVVHIKKE